MPAAQRDETELALACQGQERVAGVCGQRLFAAQMVLRRVKSAGGGAELHGHDDAVPVEIDALPGARQHFPESSQLQIGVIAQALGIRRGVSGFVGAPASWRPP